MPDDIETTAPDPLAETPAETQSASSAGEAWNDVIARMSDLGDAIGRWTKSAANDPQNRRKLDEMRASVNDMARKAETAFSNVTEDLGPQVRQGVERAGQAIEDTAKKVSAAAAPHVANALADLADAFGRAAAKVEEAVMRDKGPGEPEAPVAPAAPESTPAAAPEPPKAL